MRFAYGGPYLNCKRHQLNIQYKLCLEWVIQWVMILRIHCPGKYELHGCMVTHVLCYILYLKCDLHVAEINRFLMSPATGRKSSNKTIFKQQIS